MMQSRFCTGCGKQVPPESPRCIYCGEFFQSATFAGPLPGAPGMGHNAQGMPPRPGNTVGYIPSTPSAGAGATVVLGTKPRTSHLCYFIVKEGPDRSRVFHLDKDNIGIGRDAGNDIALKDDSVSGSQAKCRYVDENFVIQDAASANGTFVNGKEIAKHTLKTGDLVKIGETLLYYVDIETKSKPKDDE